MKSADLYFDTIKLAKYSSYRDCKQCGFPTCEAFGESFMDGKNNPDECPFIKRNTLYAFEIVNRLKEIWPKVPLLVHPRPSYTGLIELNSPDEHSMVLVTGNNEYTEQILMTVLETTLCPFHVIFVDTDGNTLDMSMVYGTFTAERIAESLYLSELRDKSITKEMIIPGLAESLKENVQKLTGWSIRVGPECAAELPLYLSELWIPPTGSSAK